ncbi:hypothetical protein CVS40_8198 [Lucilia cuprina]|nr:hypothetical protein CVS40_8198 [Lucilia cuprina]
MIGSYIEINKPVDVNCFLRVFVREVKDLHENGLLINGNRIEVHIRTLIFDAPAKSFVVTKVIWPTMDVQNVSKLDKG